MSLSWKILIYMAADNNLYEAALVSLNQITAASRRGNVEILVQFDGPTSSLASRFRCSNGRKELLWQAPGRFTVHRGERLQEFLKWTIEKSEKVDKRIMLLLWGHGAGIDHVYVYKDSTHVPTPASPPPAVAVRHDIDFRTKALLNSENANIYVSNIQLGEILRQFTKSLGKKIDIFALDACLMGMTEICHEVRDSVSLMVASDEEIPQTSFPYPKILRDLETYPGMDPASFAALMVSRFVEGYASDKGAAENGIPLSLSTYNLAACDSFAKAFQVLVKAIQDNLTRPTFQARVTRARDFSRTPLEGSYIDLAVFLGEIVASFDPRSKPSRAIHAAAAEALRLLLSEPYIVYHRDLAQDGAIDSRGLALYFPENLDSIETDAGQSILDETATNETDTPEMRFTRPHPRPIQPAFLATKADVGCKSPVPSTVSPIRGTKQPATGCKSITSPDGNSRTLTSYRVLWDQYIRLDFNKQTGWSDLVLKFLPHVPAPVAPPAAVRGEAGKK